MSSVPSEITHVSDTALMVAAARAIETGQPDAFVRDPFATRLAGDRGMAIFQGLPHPMIMGFGIAVRSKFLDELLLEAVATTGLSTVVCLGAGLDTRPWRLELPRELRWIEVDFAAMLDYKEGLMAGESTTCRRERLTADVTDREQRQAIYATVGQQPALMITEGLLMYLPKATVESIAAEAWQESGVGQWISDITTSAFSKALGGGGTQSVRHVQADDHLAGEEILEVMERSGWRRAAGRSYITDMAFSAERVKKMMGGRPQPPSPFAPGDPTGVHRFTR